MQSVNLVLDANIVVDLVRGFTDAPSENQRDLATFVNTLGDSVRPVVSLHIVNVARTKLAEKYVGEAQADKLLTRTLNVLKTKGLVFDSTKEDYPALNLQCRSRFGTDTEDEAVVACAERKHASLVTNDRDLRSYMRQTRIVETWSLSEYVAQSTNLVAA